MTWLSVRIANEAPAACALGRSWGLASVLVTDKIIITTASGIVAIGKRRRDRWRFAKERERSPVELFPSRVVEIKRRNWMQRYFTVVAEQLEGRVTFKSCRRAEAITVLQKSGAKGIRIQCSGRLGGAGWVTAINLSRGRVLHTLRAKIDYGFAAASDYGVYAE